MGLARLLLLACLPLAAAQGLPHAKLLTDDDGGAGGECSSQVFDTGTWCAQGAALCGVDGEVGRMLRAACPNTCQSCKVPGGAALDKALQDGKTVEYRTGMILPGTQSTSRAILMGWDAWLVASKANTTGLTLGNGHLRILNTNIMVSDSPNCTEYAAAARELVNVHKVDAAYIIHHNCKTSLSEIYTKAGVIHFVQSGTPMVFDNGDPYSSNFAWYVHLDSNNYPQGFLSRMVSKGWSKAGVVWWKGHAWTTASAKYVMDVHLPLYGIELVYSHGWEPEEGGGLLTTAGASEYVELYDTALWDKMLMDMSEAGVEVFICYSIGEGASILKRMQALGISFKGVYVTVTPSSNNWAKYLQYDGDYVLTPGQWSSDTSAPCVLFGSAQKYNQFFVDLFGQMPDYTAASQTVAGMMLQLALQTYNSTSTEALTDALHTMSHETMFGRVHFSQSRRNIGRAPVGMQWQSAKLKTVMPEGIAMDPYLDFVDWRCRVFFNDTTPQCTDEEYAVFDACLEGYPDLIDPKPCTDRANSEALNEQLSFVVPLAVVGFIFLVLFACYLAMLHSARNLAYRSWIDFNDLNLTLDKAGNPVSNILGMSLKGMMSATWHGQKVLLKPMSRSDLESLSFTPNPFKLWKVLTSTGRVKEALHLKSGNLVAILGLTTNKNTRVTYLVTELMALGSLHNVLQGEAQAKVLDHSSEINIASNLVSGMHYLHLSKPPFIHGAIRAKHVFLDEKLTAKVRIDIPVDELPTLDTLDSEISGLGSVQEKSRPPLLRRGSKGALSASEYGTAWQAPELLNRSTPHTWASDVYALGMTIWEVFSKTDPYDEYDERNPMALSSSVYKRIVEEDLRPTIPMSMPPGVAALVQKCWAKEPSMRPTLKELAESLATEQQTRITSFATVQRAQSESKNRDLVNRMLPADVAAALKEGQKVEPRSFDNVTVFFSDIVGFTEHSGRMAPAKVMNMLDRLYNKFDAICTKYDLFKVETIGDAYMCVGGLHKPQMDHTARIACFAMEAVAAANTVAVDEDAPDLGVVSIRAGFHCGPVVASVVGNLQPRYCLFGDTVNIASRMESLSDENMINLSRHAQQCLVGQNTALGCRCKSRGQMRVKGKGDMECFFLTNTSSTADASSNNESVTGNNNGSPQASLTCLSLPGEVTVMTL